MNIGAAYQKQLVADAALRAATKRCQAEARDWRAVTRLARRFVQRLALAMGGHGPFDGELATGELSFGADEGELIFTWYEGEWAQIGGNQKRRRSFQSHWLFMPFEEALAEAYKAREVQLEQKRKAAEEADARLLGTINPDRSEEKP